MNEIIIEIVREVAKEWELPEEMHGSLGRFVIDVIERLAEKAKTGKQHTWIAQDAGQCNFVPAQDCANCSNTTCAMMKK